MPSVAKKPQISLPLNEVQEVHPGDELKSKITFSPLIDIFFDPKEEQLVFLLDIPGAAKEDICIEVGDGLLSISGPRSKTELKEKYGSQLSLIAHERNTGFFCRSFQLPFNALEDTVVALLNGGRTNRHRLLWKVSEFSKAHIVVPACERAAVAQVFSKSK